MDTYEYMTELKLVGEANGVTMAATLPAQAGGILADQLTARGREGWELTSVVPFPAPVAGGKQALVFIYKRRVVPSVPAT